MERSNAQPVSQFLIRRGILLTKWDLGTILAKAALVLVPAILIFWLDLKLAGYAALNSDYYNYVLVLPFLILFLVFLRWKYLARVLLLRDKDPGHLNQIAGISTLIVSLIVYVYGSYTVFPLNYHLIALELFLASSILLFFNRTTLKVLIFPIFLMSAALPAAVQFGLGFWLDISQFSTAGAYDILRLLGMSVTLTTTVSAPTLAITTANGSPMSFVVGVASSGIYSVVGFSVFALFLAYIAEGSLVRRGIFFAFGFLLIGLVNVVRLVIVIGAAYLWGTVAFNAFHFSSGIVLVFIVTFLLLLMAKRFFGLDIFPAPSSRAPSFSSIPRSVSGKSMGSQRGGFLQNITKNKLNKSDLVSIASLLIIVALFLLSLAPATVVATTPSSVNISSLSPQSALRFLPQIRGWNLSYVSRDTQVQELLDEDAALLYTYTSSNGSLNDQIFASLQVSAAGLHTPEASLVQFPVFKGQSASTVLEDSNVVILEKSALIGRFFVYQTPNSNVSQVNLYWNVRSVFNLGFYSDFRYAQIGLSTTTQNLEQSGAIDNTSNLEAAEQFLLPLAQAIANFWQPQQTLSSTQVYINQYSLPATLSTIIIACGVGAIEWVRNKGLKIIR